MIHTVRRGENLSVIAVGEGFLMHLRVAFVCSLFLSAPWWLWQAWAFIRPGLYPKERRLAIPFVLLTTAFFLLGGWFAYDVGLPPTLDYLPDPGPRIAPGDLDIDPVDAVVGQLWQGLAVRHLPGFDR